MDKVLIQTCREISKWFEINMVEIGTDENHVHFLIQFMERWIFCKYCRKICNEEQIKNYVRDQGKEYTLMYRGQLKLFE